MQHQKYWAKILKHINVCYHEECRQACQKKREEAKEEKGNIKENKMKVFVYNERGTFHMQKNGK